MLITISSLFSSVFITWKLRLQLKLRGASGKCLKPVAVPSPGPTEYMQSKKDIKKLHGTVPLNSMWKMCTGEGVPWKQPRKKLIWLPYSNVIVVFWFISQQFCSFVSKIMYNLYFLIWLIIFYKEWQCKWNLYFTFFCRKCKSGQHDNF